MLTMVGDGNENTHIDLYPIFVCYVDKFMDFPNGSVNTNTQFLLESRKHAFID